jgi:hypothetical protein
MMTNKEFAATSHIDAPLSGEMAEFAMFTIDLGEVKTAKGGIGCKRVVKPAFPHLVGKGVNLWDVTPRKEGLTLAEAKAEVAKQNELDRLARLEGYIKAGFAFDERALNNPQGGEDEEDEEDTPEEGDEWSRFFADDEKPSDRGGRRHGRVRNDSSFEGFVDAAQ